MLAKLLGDVLSPYVILAIGGAVGFLATVLLLRKPFSKLPRDGGKRVVTPEGEVVVINDKSSGKVTGTGVLFVPVFLLVSLLCLPISGELLMYIGLMFLMMLTGYLDDAAKTPWGELLKGMLDLAITFSAVLVFIFNHSTTIMFFGHSLDIPKPVYLILGVILMWASVNVTNCSDGVDGLCGSVSVIELVAYFAIFRLVSPVYSHMGILLAAVLLGYLIFNWFPSKALMGDAGSRTIGFFLGLMALQSGHPFIFLILSLVFLLDGGLGLLKLTVIRVTGKKGFMSRLRTPIHDHLRKNMNMPVPKVALIFAGLQLLFSIAAVLLMWI